MDRNPPTTVRCVRGVRYRKREGPRPKKAGAPNGSSLCHDATPWTHYNRVPLCQATLSIGPYLLLKVQFQRFASFPDMSDFKPGAAHQKPRWHPTEREAGLRDIYCRADENSWEVSSPALMPATTLETGETHRTGPRAGSAPRQGAPTLYACRRHRCRLISYVLDTFLASGPSVPWNAS